MKDRVEFIPLTKSTEDAWIVEKDWRKLDGK